MLKLELGVLHGTRVSPRNFHTFKRATTLHYLNKVVSRLCFVFTYLCRHLSSVLIKKIFKKNNVKCVTKKCNGKTDAGQNIPVLIFLKVFTTGVCIPLAGP